jgi:2-dehydropantoate 2-reductase
VRVTVLGAGSLGSLVGAHLAQTHDVTLVGRDPHMKTVASDGLRVVGETDLHVHPRAVTDAADAPPPDVLLVTVKAYDTDAALRDARPLLDANPVVASLQNGLGNLETLPTHVTEDRVVGAVTTHGATREAPGVVRHAGAGATTVGAAGHDPGPAEIVADALEAGGVPADVTDAIRGEIWAKVVVNAGINPVTAITGLPNGALLEDPQLEATMEAAAREAVTVAEAEGVDLPDADLVERTRSVARRTAENTSSMLQDIQRGRRTEIDAISGAVHDRSRDHDLYAPVNRTLAALVGGIEETTRTDGPGLP